MKMNYERKALKCEDDKQMLHLARENAWLNL